MAQMLGPCLLIILLNIIVLLVMYFGSNSGKFIRISSRYGVAVVILTLLSLDIMVFTFLDNTSGYNNMVPTLAIFMADPGVSTYGLLSNSHLEKQLCGKIDSLLYGSSSDLWFWPSDTLFSSNLNEKNSNVQFSVHRNGVLNGLNALRNGKIVLSWWRSVFNNFRSFKAASVIIASTYPLNAAEEKLVINSQDGSCTRCRPFDAASVNGASTYPLNAEEEKLGVNPRQGYYLHEIMQNLWICFTLSNVESPSLEFTDDKNTNQFTDHKYTNHIAMDDWFSFLMMCLFHLLLFIGRKFHLSFLPTKRAAVLLNRTHRTVGGNMKSEFSDMQALKLNIPASNAMVLIHPSVTIFNYYHPLSDECSDATLISDKSDMDGSVAAAYRKNLAQRASAYRRILLNREGKEQKENTPTRVHATHANPRIGIETTETAYAPRKVYTHCASSHRTTLQSRNGANVSGNHRVPRGIGASVKTKAHTGNTCDIPSLFLILLAASHSAYPIRSVRKPKKAYIRMDRHYQLTTALNFGDDAADSVPPTPQRITPPLLQLPSYQAILSVTNLRRHEEIREAAPTPTTVKEARELAISRINKLVQFWVGINELFPNKQVIEKFAHDTSYSTNTDMNHALEGCDSAASIAGQFDEVSVQGHTIDLFEGLHDTEDLPREANGIFDSAQEETEILFSSADWTSLDTIGISTYDLDGEAVVTSMYGDNTEHLATSPPLVEHTGVESSSFDVTIALEASESAQSPHQNPGSGNLVVDDLIYSTMEDHQLKATLRGRVQDGGQTRNHCKRSRPSKAKRAIIKAILNRRRAEAATSGATSTIHLEDLSGDDEQEVVLINSADFGEYEQNSMLAEHRSGEDQTSLLERWDQRASEDIGQFQRRTKVPLCRKDGGLAHHSDSDALLSGRSRRATRDTQGAPQTRDHKSCLMWELIYGCGMDGGESESTAQTAHLLDRWNQRAADDTVPFSRRDTLQVQVRGRAPVAAGPESLTVVNFETFRENLLRWIESAEGGRTGDFSLEIEMDDIPMIHAAMTRYHTEELTNSTPLKFLTENSAPIPAEGLVILQLVGVPPAALPDDLVQRNALLKDQLLMAGLSVNDDSTYIPRARTSHCFRYLGSLDAPVTIEAMLNVTTADEHTYLYDLVNGVTKLPLDEDEECYPIDICWLYEGHATVKLKLNPFSMSLWMSFHHLVAGLAPRACVAAFLSWFLTGLRRLEANEEVRDSLRLGGTNISDQITGMDVLTNPMVGGVRQRVPFYHQRALWLVALCSYEAARKLEQALKEFNFTLPLAGNGTLLRNVTFNPGTNRQRNPTDLAYLRSWGIYENNNRLAVRPPEPPAYAVTIDMGEGEESMLELLATQIREDIVHLKLRNAILSSVWNVFRSRRSLGLLFEHKHSLEMDTATNPMKTEGRWFSCSFTNMGSARTFARGIQYIMEHRFNRDEVNEATAQVNAGRGLYWSPAIDFWGYKGCQWLYANSQDFTLRFQTIQGGRVSDTPLAGTNVRMMRNYVVEDDDDGDEAGGEWQMAGARGGRRGARGKGRRAGGGGGGVKSK